MALGWRKGYQRYKEFFLDILSVSKRRQDLRMFLEILLTLGIVSFLAIFALRPTFITIAELLREIQAREELVLKLDEKIKDLDAAQASFSRESQRIAVIDSAIPSLPSPETFIRQVDGLTSNSGASLSSVTIGEVALVGGEKEEANPDLSELPESTRAVPFSATVNGSYGSFLSFLSGIENFRRPAVIDSLVINASDSEGVQILLLVISGRTPYLGL